MGNKILTLMFLITSILLFIKIKRGREAVKELERDEDDEAKSLEVMKKNSKNMKELFVIITLWSIIGVVNIFTR